MDLHQYYFELVYKIVRKQNEALVREIARRECIPVRELIALVPSRQELKEFTRLRQESDTAPASPAAQ
jgi:hypothetical protein